MTLPILTSPNSPQKPHPLSSPHLNLILYLCTFLVVILDYPLNLSRMVSQNYTEVDVSWHLAAGEEILKTRSIPTTDPWSFTADQQWYNISWLHDIFLALVYTWTGNAGLQLLGIFLSGLLAAEIFRVLKNWVECPQARFIAASLAGLATINSGELRPQMMAQFLLLYSLATLEKGQKNPKALWILPALMLLWANLHGSFPLLGLLIGLYWTINIIQKNFKTANTLLLCGVLATAFTFLNPIGAHLYIGMNRTLNSCITSFINEWQPWSLNIVHKNTTIPFILAVVASALLLPNKANPRERILALFGLILGISSIRFIPILAILGAPFLTQQLSHLPKLKTQWLTALLAISLLTGAILGFTHQKYIYKTFAEDSAGPALYHQAVDYIVQNHPNERILNEYGSGGRIIRQGKGKIKHYLDGRAGTAYSENILQEYIDIYKSEVSVPSLIEKYDITAALLSTHTHAFTAIAPELIKAGWTIPFKNSQAFVFTKPKEDTTKKNKPKKEEKPKETNKENPTNQTPTQTTEV
jgi:hypothetical protein